MPLRNPGQRIRQVECDDDQRRRNCLDAGIVVFLELRVPDLGWRRLGPRTQVATRPHAGCIVPLAASRREPHAIHFKRPHDAVLRIIHRHVTHLLALAIGQRVEGFLEVIDITDWNAADFGDDCAARNRRFGQDVSRVGDIYAFR